MPSDTLLPSGLRVPIKETLGTPQQTDERGKIFFLMIFLDLNIILCASAGFGGIVMSEIP